MMLHEQLNEYYNDLYDELIYLGNKVAGINPNYIYEKRDFDYYKNLLDSHGNLVERVIGNIAISNINCNVLNKKFHLTKEQHFSSMKYIPRTDINRYKMCIKKIENAIDSLEAYFESKYIKMIPYNDFFNSLYLLDKYMVIKNEKIHKFIIKYRYYEEIEPVLVSIATKLQNKISLKDYEYKLLLLSLEQGNFNIIDPLDASSYIIKSHILKEKNITYHQVEQAIQIYFLERMLEYTDIPRFKIIEKQDDTLAAAVPCCIKATKGILKNFYEDPTNTPTLFYLFHELAHIKQSSMKVATNMTDLKIIKEYILFNELEYYDNLNYEVSSYEKEANIKAYYDTRLFCKNFGIDYHMDEDDLVNEVLEFLNNTRNIKFEENGRVINTNVDELFDKFISDRPDLLYNYPILNMEYKVYKDRVVPKSEDELYKNLIIEYDYESLSYDEMIGQFNIYRELINKAKNKKKARRKKK